MSKARKIVTYLMVGMMVLTNFQNRLYADDGGAEASSSSPAASESSSASSSSDSAGGSSDSAGDSGAPAGGSEGSSNSGSSDTGDSGDNGDTPGGNESGSNDSDTSTDTPAETAGGDSTPTSGEGEPSGEQTENPNGENTQTPTRDETSDKGEIGTTTPENPTESENNQTSESFSGGENQSQTPTETPTTSTNTEEGTGATGPQGDDNTLATTQNTQNTENNEKEEKSDTSSDTPNDTGLLAQPGLKNMLKSPMMRGVNNFTFDTITISKPAGYTGVGPDQIVIMDRNLGATSNDITSSDSYGYHYQWGNNFGFPIDGEITILNKWVNTSDYGPSNPYNSGTFLVSNDGYWESSENDNLRGGAGDLEDDSYGLDNIEETQVNRQGPCPAGYHVPSIGEWSKVIEYRAYAHGQEINGSNLKSFSNDTNIQAFREDIHIPFAGYRDYYDGSLSSYGTDFWSSSYGLYYSVSDPYVYNSNGPEAYGYSVRCFKNYHITSHKNVTFSVFSGGVIGNQTETFTEWSGTFDEETMITIEGATLTVGDQIFTAIADTGATFSGRNNTCGATIATDCTITAEFTQEEPQERTFDTITISKPAGYTGVGPDQIVIMDRNLGATSNDITSPDSYGLFFQWGNNHGLSPDAPTTKEKVEWNESYAHKGYYGGDSFFFSNYNYNSYDYWSDGVEHDDLRGGENDSASNNRGLDDIETTAVNRQGPCEEGYHVPSIGEWSKVFEYRCLNNSDKCTMSNMRLSNGLYKSSDSSIGDNFSSALKIPFAGYREYYDGSWSDVEELASLRTSSPRSDDIFLGSSNVTPSSTQRAYGMSIRCFKNLESNSSGLTLSFDSNGGSLVDSITGLEEGDDISGYRPKKDPTKAGYMFLGWFDENGERFMFEGKTISEDITLTAHWAEFHDLVYTGIIDGVEKTIVLMDRNFGATSTDLSSTDSDGYFYQWGNNFGFDTNVANIQFTTSKADVSGYGPENPYYGEKFIKQADWATGTRNNLRGGVGDKFSNDYDDENERAQRQGPCTEGYHVPSLKEGNELVMLYFANNGIDSQSASGLFYPNTVGQGDGAKYPLSSEQEADFRETFKLPQSGMIRHGGTKERHRTDTKNNRQQSFLATSTSHGTGKYVLMQTNTGNKGTYVNVGGWVETIGDATPIRCFKSITERPLDPEPEDVFTVAITTEGSGSVDQNSVEVTSGSVIEFTGNTVTIGDITITATPETTNAQYVYDFDEWGNTCGDTVTNSCTITAKFSSTVREYTITFKNWNQNGNGHDNLRQRNYHYGETPIYDGVAPTREADAQYTYTFSGWTPEIHAVDGNTTYTASYTPTLRSYTISWEKDGTPLTESQTLEYGATPEYEGPVPTKDSANGHTYTFRGWTDGENEIGKDDPFPTVKGNTTYTAVFDETVESYLIQFIGYNEEILQTGNYEYGENPTYTGSTPTRPGHTFSGWDNEITSVTGPKDYTATWKACEVCSAETGANCSLSIEENQCTYMTTCKVGYQNITGNATPNPSCSLISYSLSYTGIDGLTVDNPDSYTIETDTIILNEPSKIGFSFKGWFADGVKVTQIEKGSTGNKSFTAMWEAIPYTITFVLGNGEEDIVMTGHYGESITFPSDPTRADHTFAGWDSVVFTTFPDSDKTITAQWNTCAVCEAGTGASCSLNVVNNVCTYTNYCENGYGNIQNATGSNPYCEIENYTITYILSGGVNASSNPTSYNINSESITLADPIKEGYSFSGWTPFGAISQGSTGNKTFTANWNINQYKVTFVTATGNIVIEDDFGTPITAPTNLKKEGYTFSGWDKTVPETIPAADITITAIWNACTACAAGTGASCEMNVVENQCTYTNACLPGYTGLQNATAFDPVCTPTSFDITYVLNGGVNNVSNPQNYTIESDTIELADPTKEGYTFNGWTPSALIPQGSTGNKSFTANWKVNQYQITFDLANSTDPVVITGDYGSAVTAPKDFTKAGHTFSGWDLPIPVNMPAVDNLIITAQWNSCTACAARTGASCEMYVENNICKYNTSCQDGYDTITGAGTATPSCSPIPFDITYKLNGGENNPSNPQNYTIESDTITLANPTKKGHSFSMWKEGNLIPQGSTGDKTFEALWDVNQYQITFNLDNGTDPIVLNQDYDSDITAPATPTKAGHTFSGWDKEIPATMPAETTTITAQWNACPVCEARTGAECTLYVEDNVCKYQTSCKDGYDNIQGSGTITPSCSPISYNITYELSGGENNPSNPQNYTIESDTIELADPTKEGYTFNGWTPSALIPQGSTGDKTFIANWTPKIYTIIFSSKYSAPIAPITGTYNESVKDKMPSTPVRTGYLFNYWAVTGNNYQFYTNGQKFNGSKETFKEDIILKPDWTKCTACKAGTGVKCTLSVVENKCTYTNTCLQGYTGLQNATGYNASCTPISYNITYELSGGVNASSNPTTYTIEDVDIILAEPTKEGHTFKSWDPTDRIFQGSFGDKVFTALWNVNSYLLVFNFDNTTTGIIESKAYGTPITIPAETPTKKGHIFKGWGEVPATMPATGLRINAQWEECQRCNPGNGATCEMSVVENTCHYETSCKDGYDTLQGSGTSTPSCSLISYSISYELSGGVMTGAETGYTIESDTITLPIPTKEGYTFSGWTPASTIPHGSTGDKNFIANWTVNQYTITFDTDGGNTIPSITQDYGSSIEAPANPQKVGHSFAGWDKEIPATMPNYDMTIKATWILNTYDITWQDDRGEILRIDHEIPYGVMPAYSGATPEKEADKQYTYEFSHWDPEIKTVTKNQTYTAVFSKTTNKYSVTFLDDKGMTISSELYPYGTEITDVVIPTAPFLTGYRFAGWKLTTQTLGTPDQVKGNLEYQASYIKDTYTITYILEGNTHAEIEKAYKEQINPIQVETREGYTFSGWTPALGYTMPAMNLTVYGEYVINKHWVHFNTNGGTKIAQYQLNYNDSIIMPDDPTKTGAVFKGWDKEYTNMPDADVYFNAQWETCQVCIEGNGATCEMSVDNNTCHYETSCKDGYGHIENNGKYNPVCRPLSYSISYDVDGGENNENNPDSYDIESATIVLSAPTRTGFSFAGWTPTNKIVKGSTGDKIFTATWNPNTYKIVFKGNGGTVSTPTITASFGETITTPADPTREGYTFNGWTPGIPTTMPITPETGLEITAQWTINSHTLIFDFDNDTPNNVSTLEFGTPITKPADPIKKGYKFSGWSEEVPATMPDRDITLTAQYRGNIHTIRFNTDGGTPIDPIITGFAYDIIKPADPTRTGYTFSGWDQEIPSTMPDEDMMIKALWNINQYTITFDSKGGTEVASITQGYHTDITVPEDPTRTGYNFSGWNPEIPDKMPLNGGSYEAQWTPSTEILYTVYHQQEQLNGTYKNYEVSTGVATTEDEITPEVKTYEGFVSPVVQTVTVEADGSTSVTYQYARKIITLTFDANGGNATITREGKYGANVQYPHTPTKEGYTFATWNKEIPMTFPSESETFIAKWSANTYAIAYEINDGTMGTHHPLMATFDSEITIDNPTKIGYHFDGWKISEMDTTVHTYGDTTGTQKSVITNETVFKNLTAVSGATVTFTAQWTPNTDTEYQVIHHRAKVGVAGFDTETEILTGTTQMVTQALPKHYNGFSLSGVVSQTNIAADGSTVIDIYYKRNSYTVDFNVDGGTPIAAITDEYQAPIQVVDPTRTGYHFSGWNPVFPTTMPLSGETYTAQWTPYTYTTLYMLNGGTGQVGYKLVHYDEEFVVNNPTKIGYTFEGWKVSILGDEMGISLASGTKETTFRNLTTEQGDIIMFNAVWSANNDTEYTVNHYKENLDEGYDIEREILTGTTETVTNAIAKDFEGFTLSGKVTQDDIAPDGSTVIDLYYKRNSYTLSFDTDGGTKIAKITAKYGTAITGDFTTTRTGYQFSGWDQIIPSTMPAEDSVVKAQWKAMPFTITFDSDGGSTVAPITQNFGTEITAPADPTKIGHSFKGWEPEIPATMPAEDITLTAQWEAKLYKMTFDTDGGTEIDEKMYQYGSDIEVPADPTKEGYSFVKWNPDLPDTMPARDVTATAQWRINQYTITFDTDGGTEIAPITLNYNARIRAPKDPTKKDHTFSGWNVEIPSRMPAQNMTITAQWNACELCNASTGANCQLKVVNNQCTYTTTCKVGYQNITGDATPTPKCEAIVWDITYNLNDNDETPATNNTGNIETYTIEDADFTLLSPSRKGYEFKGWLDEKMKPITVLSISEKKDRNLTAKWEAKVIKITFDPQNGTGGTQSIRFKYGTNIFYSNALLKSPIASINLPHRDGYTFKNYHGDGTHGGDNGEKFVSYYNEEGIFTPFASDLSVDIYEDTTLYAEWEANKIHITLDQQEGTGGTNEFWYYFDTKEYFSDESCTVPLTRIIHPTKTGYSFQDYYDGQRFVAYQNSGTRIELDSTEENTYKTISKDTTLKARWSANTIKITLDPNGGTGGTQVFYYKYHDQTQTFYSDEACTRKITKIARPTRAGYTFVDYRGDGTHGGNNGERFVAYDTVEFADDLNTKIYEDATLKATWSANTIKITLDKQNGTGGTDEFYYKFDTQTFYSDEALQNEITEIATPTRTGYSFVSYELSGENYITLDTEGKTKFKSDLSSTFSENTTLNAHWEADKIHIHLDNEEGKGDIEDFWYHFNTKTFYSDEACTHEITEIPHPTRTGYNFKDYYSEEKGQRFVSYEKDGDRKKLTDDDIYQVISSDTTLQARWTPKTIKVSLDPNGGTGGTSSFWFKYDEEKFYSNENLTTEITHIQYPTRSGYAFINYHGDGEHGAVLDRIYISTTDTPFLADIVHDIYEDATLLASWGSNPYKVRYVNSSNEEDYKEISVTFDESFKIMPNRFIHTGYTFSGWIDENGITYQPDQEVQNLAETGTFVLKTIWEANEYTVRFLAGEGTGTMDPQVFMRDEEGKLNTNTFTKAGYTFKNWKTDEGKTFSNGAKVKNLIDSGSIELTAQWEVIKSTSRSSGGGGGSSMKKDNCPNGDHSNSYYDGKCEKDEKSDSTHGSAEEEIPGDTIVEVIDGKSYTQDDMILYTWAKKHRLTSMETIGDFRGEDGLRRSEMAKIMSIYSTGYMEKVEKATKACTQFSDITKIKGDLHDYIISACNLGIMGRTSDGKGVLEKFNPHSQVTKAEALTIISRVFRGNEYANKKGEERYEGHVRHLIEIGVVADDSDLNEPYARKDFYLALKKLHTLDF